MKGTDVVRRLAFLALFTLWTFLTLGVSPALADDGGDGQVVVDGSLHQVQTLSLLIGIVIPIVVGLVTKVVTSAATKAILLALFSAVSGILTEYAHSLGQGSFDWYSAILTWLGTFLVAVATYYGFWRPTGVAAKAQQSLVK